VEQINHYVEIGEKCSHFILVCKKSGQYFFIKFTFV